MTGDLRAFIQAFEEAWDEVVRGIPVSVDLYRFRDVFARKVLALAERSQMEGPAVSRPAGDERPPAARSSGRILNELV
jgi:hypothetical protein